MSVSVPPPVTLNGYLDACRRWVEITPPFDTGGASGAAPAGQPNPSNNVLNQCINAAIDTINRLVCIGDVQDLGPVSVPAAPFYRRGPYYIDYSPLLLYSGVPFEVVDVVWVSGDGSATVTRLEPANYYRDDPAAPPSFTQFQQFPQQPKPQSWFSAGTQIGLIPANNQGGTIYLSGRYGMNQLVNPLDVVTTPSQANVPFAFQNVIQYIAVLYLCARTLKDTNYQARNAQFLPLASDGLAAIYKWRNGSAPDGSQMIDTLRMITSSRLTGSSQPQSGQGQGQGGQQ